MNLINVTTWSGRKLHLANPDSEQPRTYGTYLPMLCGTSDAVRPGDRWVSHYTQGLMRQEFIDSLPPCKKCAKRREILERSQL
ncbi:hypothetical protein M1M07_23760 [Rhodococcus sp. HM1]|uniref:hypothetical protein n=1 Tax=Rhodococcus sp. HM1 TaxID=2937759 RepID=UPI00200AB08F|nr:hypothetical protein [Rhodococcus sp. HM1]MCK8674114.1 hypothetical protein [Rhodococcus sp. HM1]